MRVLARGLAAAAAGLLLSAAPAAAQGTDVGGGVDSLLELALNEPAGFAAFPAGAGEHEMTLRARVTATERSRLSVIDGDVPSGPRLGRLASPSSVLRQPLEARVGASVFQPLSLLVDPLLAEWRDPVANTVAVVRLRQRIEAGERPRGTYSKTLLITLSSQAP